jgi:hypothetical protein
MADVFAGGCGGKEFHTAGTVHTENTAEKRKERKGMGSEGRENYL